MALGLSIVGSRVFKGKGVPEWLRIDGEMFGATLVDLRAIFDVYWLYRSPCIIMEL